MDSTHQLRRLWPRLADAGQEVLVQELVPGPESAVESYHAYVDAEGLVAGEFTGRKIRTYPLDYGLSCSVAISHAPDAMALGREVVSRLGLTGVLKVDFKRDPRGGLHVLEVNPRFTLWSHLGARAGVNLPALVYADLAGLPRPRVGEPKAGARWCSLDGDRRAARESGVPFWVWLPWAMRSDALANFTWSDPMPLLRGALLPRLARRRRRT